MLPYNKNLKPLSRQLRDNMTEAERRLWARLRNKQLMDCQFYRQKPPGDYIFDFFCPRARLVIEVDGSQHFSAEGAQYDKIRDASLENLGLRVLRFSDSAVLRKIPGVVKSILANLESQTSSSPFIKPPLVPLCERGKTAGSPAFFKERKKRGI